MVRFAVSLMLICGFTGCAENTWRQAGNTVGVPQKMAQAAADGYVKTTVGDEGPNPYNR